MSYASLPLPLYLSLASSLPTEGGHINNNSLEHTDTHTGARTLDPLTHRKVCNKKEKNGTTSCVICPRNHLGIKFANTHTHTRTERERGAHILNHPNKKLVGLARASHPIAAAAAALSQSLSPSAVGGLLIAQYEGVINNNAMRRLLPPAPPPQQPKLFSPSLSFSLSFCMCVRLPKTFSILI